MRSRDEMIGPFDWVTFAAYCSLVLVGWLAIFTSQYDGESINILSFSTNYAKQIIWIVLSMSIFLFIQLLDTKVYHFLSYLIFGIVMMMLVSVLVYGQVVAGSKSWINFGFFKLQPSEFAKFATALALARYLGKSKKGVFFKQNNLLMAFVILGIPLALILLQGDVGSAMVFAGFIFVLNREGLSSWFIYIGLIIAVLSVFALLMNQYLLIGLIWLIALGLIYLNRKKRQLIWLIGGVAIVSSVYVLGVDFIFNEVLESHHRSRINVLLGKEMDNSGAAYNVNQSKIAIGSGGLIGKGFLQGTQTRYDFVPELSTDFIFCTIGEEFGFLGSAALISLFMFLLIRLLILAERQRSGFSRIFIYCVVAVIFMHVLINIGMTIGLMPVIGIPLPFMSYGGSSLISFSLMIALSLKLDSDRLLNFR